MTTRPYARIASASDVRETADRLGSPYFSPDTMRFFKSRLLDAFVPITDDGARGVIVVSNRPWWEGARREYRAVAYTVTRETGDDGRERDTFTTDHVTDEPSATAGEAKREAIAYAARERAALA